MQDFDNSSQARSDAHGWDRATPSCMLIWSARVSLAHDHRSWRDRTAPTEPQPPRDHRCGAVDPPTRLPVEKQEQLCLRTRHFECPAFIAATAPAGAMTVSRPVPRSAPLVLERADPVVALGSIRLPARLLQFGLASVMVVVLGVVVLGGGTQRNPATAAVGASASPSRAGTATARPSASVRIRSSSAPVAVTAASDDPTAEPTAGAETAEPTGAEETAEPTETVVDPPRAAAATAKPAKTSAPTTAVAGERTYRVRSGDTLSAIAARFGTTVSVLVPPAEQHQGSQPHSGRPDPQTPLRRSDPGRSPRCRLRVLGSRTCSALAHILAREPPLAARPVCDRLSVLTLAASAGSRGSTR